ncbi:MAG: EamA family transporter, partial [Bacteroidales bacterium]|nr:EamA family transporter [Bacteroidales bacterium]
MWLWATFASSLLLGTYEVYKKLSLKENAVIPVLFLTTVFCSLFFLPFLLLSEFAPQTLENSLFFVARVDLKTHAYIILKSFIVLSSWAAAYYAIKNLPLTIASPIKSTQPVFVLMGAFVVFGERLNLWQWLGVLVSITSIFLYSYVGKKEGISFKRNPWIWCLFLAVLIGSVSGLYDKYMMVNFDRMAVQVWYTIYQIVIMLPLLFIYMYRRKMGKEDAFSFRWSIVGLAVFLCLADFLYFYALSQPGALISVISPIRRSGVLIPFVVGALLFKDKNIKTKAW